MIITLIILLVSIGLGYGLFTSHFFYWGYNILSLKYPYYNFGVSFKGFHLTTSEGKQFLRNTFILGLVLVEIWVSFYIRIDGDKIEQEDDITTIPTPTSLVS